MQTLPEKKIRVLIVDDSSFMRMAIRSVLSKDPHIEIVGIAPNGEEGIAKAAELRPDVITMDVEMPVMDGITAVKRIMASNPCRVVMCSTLTYAGATATFDALEAGAVDFVLKHTGGASESQDQFRQDLLKKVLEAAGASIVKSQHLQLQQPNLQFNQPSLDKPSASIYARKVKYVAIGASTGGPVAVQEVLSLLPSNFLYPIIVGIHMPKAFTGPYAARLNSKCNLKVKEAIDGEVLRPGTILLAPGGQHTTLIKRPEGIVVKLVPSSDYPKSFYIPSVDLLMSTMTEATNGAMLGVILTGMGNDGFKGMQFLKSKGGVTIAQDEATSTVYGMPRACVEGGVADEVLPLLKIGPAISRTAGS